MTRICTLLVLLGWVLDWCDVVFCWCIRRGRVVVYALFGEGSFVLSKEFGELDC